MASKSGRLGNGKSLYFFVGGGVVAAVALVVFFQNHPPKPTDATGTIQGSARYHETQITPADVKVVPDTLDAWLQSDTFDKIVKDPQARRLFASGKVSPLFTNDATRQVALMVVGDAQRMVAVGSSPNVSDAQRMVAIGSQPNVSDAQKMVAVGSSPNVSDAQRMVAVGSSPN